MGEGDDVPLSLCCPSVEGLCPCLLSQTALYSVPSLPVASARLHWNTTGSVVLYSVPPAVLPQGACVLAWPDRLYSVPTSLGQVFCRCCSN